MKNNTTHHRDDYHLLKNRLLVRTFGMLFASFLCISMLYSLLLQGRIANLIVMLIERLFVHSYDRALHIYSYYIRQYMTLFFLISVLVLFGIILRFYLNEFSKYFKEISRGIDALLQPESGEITLSQELIAVEKKLNSVKHTLIQQSNSIQAAEQRKSDLIMYLAHDLKTPLASVIGYLNLLQEEPQISEPLRQKYLSISLDKAERLEDLINEFFEIARFNLSDITLQYSTINLTRLWEQLIFEFQPMLKEKDLTCRLHIAEDTMLRCDADKIQRVFDNLLRNALLYSFAHTVIEITVTETDDRLVIRFANQGNTIPAEKLERIFEQFYRLDASRSTKNGGAGLGLAIARQITELHGGTITAASQNDLITFDVTLPRFPSGQRASS